MTPDSRWPLLIPRPLRDLPADLAATAGLTILTVLVVFLPVVSETPLRVVFGLPFVLFIPGYAFIAALFPEAGTGPVDDTDDGADGAGQSPTADDDSGSEREGIDGIERVALSLGTSIAIVPLIGLVLNFTPWGIRLVPIVVSVSGFTLAMVWIAARRRWALQADDRFAVPYRDWLASGRSELFEPESQTDAALNVLLAVSVILAVASVGYVLAFPKPGEAFTEFYVLTEGDDGELVADDYPTEYTLGESKPIVVGIGNHEHRDVTYAWVVELQRVRVANNTTTVLEEQELDRFTRTVADNETVHTRYQVTPTMTGERLRLAFMLYTDRAPANATVDGAYRELHLWVNVTQRG